MNFTANKKFHTFVFFFILVNSLFFIYANTRPISWLQDEMLDYRFFWSMDSVERLTLHTGFTFEDFKKPLVSQYTVGAFRPRQISNLFEMVSFKVGQLWGGEYLRDYFLIFLHLLNVFLVWFLIRKLSGSSVLAWIAAALVLNAGASLATLLFPFRLAKILVMTFFLSGLNLIVANVNRLDRVKTSTLVLFFLILTCGFFTDESSVFLFPFYFVFVWLYQGREVLLSKRLHRYAIITLGIILGLGSCFYFYSKPFDGSNHWQQNYLSSFARYFSDPLTFIDIVRSFWIFLKRDFGYWELSPIGIMSSLAFAVIISLAVRARTAMRDRFFALFFLLVILAKTLFMPHMNVHPDIMPSDAVFPSMLYFTYYYVYVDSVLLVGALMLWLLSYRDNIKALSLMMVCVTLISLSNVINAPRGVVDTLKFHGLDMPIRKEILNDMKELKQVLSVKEKQPIYISFYPGPEALVDGRFGSEKRWHVYPAYILTMFLPELERGAAIISLDNIIRKSHSPNDNELMMARSFYDVNTRQSVDLDILRNRYGFGQITPIVFDAMSWKEISLDISGVKNGDVIFFIKGQADIIFQINDKKMLFKQTYGESYQLFWVNIEDLKDSDQAKALLTVRPHRLTEKVTVVGPTVIKK